MQNSARWVFPVTSTSRFRNILSTSQGGQAPGPRPDFASWRSSSRKAISISYTLSFLASSIRGLWLVGPMNRPLKR